jgi:signal transduction histidine kinase
MAPQQRRVRFTIFVLGLAAASVAAMAMHQAIRWYDHPVAGLLLTPQQQVCAVGMPDWDGFAQGLRFPDRVVFVDGVDLAALPAPQASSAWDTAVENAVRRGASKVHVRVATSGGLRELDLRIQPLAPGLWWTLGGGNVFIGGLYAIVALTALWTRPQGTLSRAFGEFSLLGALFQFTYFDAMTSHKLVPLFDFAYGWTPVALLILALRLPDDVPIARRFPILLSLLDTGGALVGLFFGLSAAMARDTSAPRAMWSIVLGLCALLCVVVLLGRFALATGRRRSILRIVVQSTAAPYAVISAGIVAASGSSRSASVMLLASPALALAPLATVVAFARNDLFGSRALLSRVITRMVAGAIACAGAACLGGAFAASLGVPFRDALTAAVAGALTSGPLLYFALRAVDRTFFPAISEYKPTIDQLSEDLTAISAPQEISSAVERTVRRWLPCDRVAFIVQDDGRSYPPTAGLGDEISIDAKFGGRTLGQLRVGEKRGGALFTTEDIDLLKTIANQAALAVAHARSYAELEQRRRQQAAAWQVERLALVETLAAEVAHEIRYPINFFRSVFQRAQGETLDRDEIEVGGEEVDRLERLVSGLKRLVGYHVERKPVSLVELASHAEVLLRDVIGERALQLNVPPSVALRCDPDQVRQVLVNLVANALEASGPRGQVGVGWAGTDGGGELFVWDEGPGFRGDPSSLFVPWFTTKPQGTGLGLAITQRIVRAHNWTIDAIRSEGRTRFVVSVPRADIVDGRSEDPMALEEAV